MEQNKEQLIADLYALRSGLSYISEQTDALKQTQTETENEVTALTTRKETEQQNYQKELEECKRKTDKKFQEYSKRKERVKELERSYQSMERRTEKQIEESALSEGKIECRNWNDKFSECAPSDDEGYHVAWCIFSVLVPPIGFFYFNIWFIKYSIRKKAYKKRVKKFVQKKKFEHQQAIFKCKNDLKTEKSLCELNYREWKSLESLYELKQKEEEKLLAEATQLDSDIESKQSESQAVALVLTEKAQGMKLALNNTYDSWLSESDWQNTDLLIYYLETGRADDLKEALLLVDKQRQTDQIVRAVREAGIAVQTSIETSMARLGDGLARSFSVLSSQLERVSLRLSRMATAQEESLAASERNMQRLGAQISENLSAQVSAMELNNSLLKKSNSTSEELLNDLRYNQRFWVK